MNSRTAGLIKNNKKWLQKVSEFQKVISAILNKAMFNQRTDI